MEKKTAKKATYKDLLKKKLQKEKDSFKAIDIYVTSMDRTLTFVKPNEEKLINLLDEINENSTTSEQLDFTRKMIYLSCPMLQDTELHQELEIQDPFDVVKSLFDIKDINEIGEQLNKLIGIDQEVEKIKN